jgi:hypothetical protein
MQELIDAATDTRIFWQVMNGRHGRASRAGSRRPSDTDPLARPFLRGRLLLEKLAMSLILPILAVVTAALTALYGIYHVIVGIKKHGWLYTRNRPSSTSALGNFVALQQMIEPQVQHVIEVKERQQLPTHRDGANDNTLVTDTALPSTDHPDRDSHALPRSRVDPPQPARLR